MDARIVHPRRSNVVTGVGNRIVTASARVGDIIIGRADLDAGHQAARGNDDPSLPALDAGRRSAADHRNPFAERAAAE